jgi:hypothetical protein
MESAGTRTKGNVQALSFGITAIGVDRVAADKAQTHCPRLEGSPLVFEQPKLCRYVLSF